jgi:plastocyanin
MTNVSRVLLATAVLVLFGVACESSGAGGRKVEIVQTDGGCSPGQITVTPGEKLNLVVKNESSHDAYEVEGIDGTKLEEVVVHEGKSLSVGYTVPSGGGVQKIKCYVPAGTSTIIELTASGSAAETPETSATAATAGASPSPSSEATTEASATVAVTLVEYAVSADKPTVSAGKIRFIATNTSSTQVHELAVLKVRLDGSFDNIGEIEDIDPEQGGSVVLDLEPGAYQLACLITIGEAGSTVDHYQQGMHTPFTVN